MLGNISPTLAKHGRSPRRKRRVAERLAAADAREPMTMARTTKTAAMTRKKASRRSRSRKSSSALMRRCSALIEALDADRADLPKLLDEALKGSLWARQIAREDEDVPPLHKKVFEARADLIWKTTTAQARRGHFAMGVGLEAGLTIDAMADELAELIDRADEASLSGDIDELVGCARRSRRAAAVHAAVHPRQGERAAGELEGHPAQLGVGRGRCQDRTAEHAGGRRGIHLSFGLGAGSRSHPAHVPRLVAGDGGRRRCSGGSKPASRNS